MNNYNIQLRYRLLQFPLFHYLYTCIHKYESLDMAYNSGQTMFVCLFVCLCEIIYSHTI